MKSEWLDHGLDYFERLEKWKKLQTLAKKKHVISDLVERINLK